MRFDFNEEQQELRAQARRFLDRHSSAARVRTAMESERGYDPEVYSQLAELGWTGLFIPEAFGGVGLGYVELVGLMEEMGRALLCSPFFSSICLAANSILVAGNDEQKSRFLPSLAEGESRATLAVAETDGQPCSESVEVTALRDGDEYVLSGSKRFIVDGHTADTIIVAARAPESSGREGVSLFVVPANAPGLTATRLPTMDATRSLAAIDLDAVRVPVIDRLGPEGSGAESLDRIIGLAGIALAAEQLGGAQRCLDMAVEYACVRTQFGRPIGSFQAIKHKCADMLVLVESARSAAYYAGWAAANDDPELPTLAPATQAYCSEAFFHCAAENIQIHGGIGFTWEHDAHLYFKRAKSSGWLMGTADRQREQVADRIGL